MNYLDLTNEAIRESGISLNALTSGNFTSSTLDPMYTKFKNFVIQAWEEIQTRARLGVHAAERCSASGAFHRGVRWKFH